MKHQLLIYLSLIIICFSSCCKEEIENETIGLKMQMQIENVISNHTISQVVIYRLSIEHDSYITENTYDVDHVTFSDGVLNYNNSSFYNLAELKKYDVVESKNEGIYLLNLYY